MLKGIDISKHNGNINFKEVKLNVDFVIIRCAYRGIKNRKIFTDEKFHVNIRNANTYQIPAGVYIYSTAINADEAVEEAKYCLNLIKNYNIEYPVIIDVEDPTNQRNLSKEKLTSIISSFCDEIEKNGYYAMFYCSEDWLQNKINYEKVKKYDLWIAKWSNKSPQNEYGIWQYSDDGIIKGIRGRVDLNVSCKDYLNVIRKNKLNMTSNIIQTYKIGDHVNFSRCYISSDSVQPLIPLIKSGKITNIKVDGINPYLIENNLCWIREEDILE